MNHLLIAGIAVAAGLGLAGFAQAQAPSQMSTPVPPATADTHVPNLTISGNPDPALHDLGDGILVYDLRSSKMINCQSAGYPAAGSVGRTAPAHPCR
jgi:hypothetical protein